MIRRRPLLRKLRSLALPEGAVLVVWLLILHWSLTREPLSPVLPYFPALVVGVGLLLAARFRSGRLLLGLLALALVERALHGLAVPAADAGPGGTAAFQATAILLPPALAILGTTRERGIFTRPGLVRLAGLGLGAGAVVVLRLTGGARVARLLEHGFVPEGLFAWTPVGQPALLAFVLTAAFLVVRQLRRPRAFTRGFLWSLPPGFLSLQAAAGSLPGGLEVNTYAATAGLLLLVAAVEASHEMAYRDRLTDLPSRRALEEDLLRLGRSYTVAMVDVDHFKAFNDRYGHDVGDQVLRMVATRLRDASGPGRAYRYGGEEFTLLFPGQDPEIVMPYLERAREAVEDSVFVLRGAERPDEKPDDPERFAAGDGDELSVTVSIGVASPDEEQADPEAVVEAADEALYRAKGGGRNRVAT